MFSTVTLKSLGRKMIKLLELEFETKPNRAFMFTPQIFDMLY